MALKRRVGASAEQILAVQGNLANAYKALGRNEHALGMRRDVYSELVRLHGEGHFESLREAFNYANDLLDLKRCGEAKSFLHKEIPVAQRILGEIHDITLSMRSIYAEALYRAYVYRAEGATLDDVREAVETYEDAARIARRVFGNTHPLTTEIERNLRIARAALQIALRLRETPPESTMR